MQCMCIIHVHPHTCTHKTHICTKCYICFTLPVFSAYSCVLQSRPDRTVLSVQSQFVWIKFGDLIFVSCMCILVLSEVIGCLNNSSVRKWVMLAFCSLEVWFPILNTILFWLCTSICPVFEFNDYFVYQRMLNPATMCTLSLSCLLCMSVLEADCFAITVSSDLHRHAYIPSEALPVDVFSSFNTDGIYRHSR